MSDKLCNKLAIKDLVQLAVLRDSGLGSSEILCIFAALALVRAAVETRHYAKPRACCVQAARINQREKM